MIDNGTYDARITSVAYVGTIPKTWKQETKYRKTIVLTFELLDVFTDTQDGPIRSSVSKEYTFYLGEKSALKRDVEIIINRKLTEQETDYSNKSELFRVTDMLNMLCVVSVESTPWEKDGKSGINTKIKSIVSMQEKYKKMAEPAQRVLNSFDIRKYSSLEHLRDSKEFRFCNGFVKAKIKQSKEYQKLK